ncbi:hypothetical protein CHUAL_008484 [Chamberlinius hualienensis]
MTNQTRNYMMTNQIRNLMTNQTMIIQSHLRDYSQSKFDRLFSSESVIGKHGKNLDNFYQRSSYKDFKIDNDDTVDVTDYDVFGKYDDDDDDDDLVYGDSGESSDSDSHLLDNVDESGEVFGKYTDDLVDDDSDKSSDYENHPIDTTDDIHYTADEGEVETDENDRKVGYNKYIEENSIDESSGVASSGDTLKTTKNL